MPVIEFIYQLIKNSKLEVKVMILYYNDFLNLKFKKIKKNKINLKI